jgi:predicted nucleotidyltransferase
LKIDLIIAERSWEREALLKSARAGKFRVVRPEYLILMKLKAGRDKDIEDVVLLSRVVDVEKTKKLVKRYLGVDYEEDFESLVMIAKSVGSDFGKGRMSSWGVGD